VLKLDTRDIAIEAAVAAAAKKATDIVVLDVAETLVITAYFVIATGASDRQVSAIVDEVETTLREKCGVRPLGREGEREARWVLLDFGDVVVHVFQPEERDFYRLEKLWSDAPRVALPPECA
jgi:ribosome-associated protein